MYRLTAKIEITGAKSWRLEKVTEVEITRDTEKLTDECRLTLPKKIIGYYFFPYREREYHQ